jgi:hypothetical protein
VPVGAQIAVLLNTSSGCPIEVTRAVPTTYCAVTHGPLPAGGGGNAQPATTYGVDRKTVGIDDTATRGFGAVGCACPACEQRIVAP